MRKKGEGFSIEEVFNVLLDYLHSQKKELPSKSSSVYGILNNIIHARKHRKTISHISGDIHYIALGTGKNTVLTIHDIKSIIKGNIFRKLIFKALWFWIPALIVSKITVISNFTKNELTKIIPFARNKIIVIYNPYNQKIVFQTKSFNKIKPNILHIGTKENKNLIRVIQAISKINCHLTIVGTLTVEQTQYLQKYKISYSNEVNVSFDRIAALYCECDIVSFPSLYEGFGMPILEGNKAGRVVLSSNVCSMPEIAGNSACLVDPTNVLSIRNGFQKIIEEEDYREKLIKNGWENLKRFTPETIAQQYNNLYQEL